MIHKHPIDPHRLRRIPKQFSWVDHRLVQQGYIQRCSHKALALYLLLLTVADAQGLSYYGEPSLCKRLCMSQTQLDSARSELVRVGLIAFQHPLYQVLSLEASASSTQRPSNQESNTTLECKAFGQILGELMGGSHD